MGFGGLGRVGDDGGETCGIKKGEITGHSTIGFRCCKAKLLINLEKYVMVCFDKLATFTAFTSLVTVITDRWDC